MRYRALATDYDGTLALGGVVDTATARAIQRFRQRGGIPILVTGRELADLERVFPRLDLFERIVAENGALLYNPGTCRERLLASPPDARFVMALRAHGVTPLSVGRVIVATDQACEQVLRDVIGDVGLELDVIFNKGSLIMAFQRSAIEQTS